MADYDPSDPETPLPWQASSQWAMSQYFTLPSVRSQYYSGPPGLILGGGGPSWSPEELPVEERRIITPQEFRSSPSIIQVDARLLRFLNENPQQILSLTWRQFEKLIGLLLEGFGYHVVVSPVGPDGGVDIFADRTTEIGPELVLVQCKRHATTKRVGVPIVKQFCMDIEDRGATRGLIATTSTFTRVALNYIDWKKHRVSGADRSKVEEWIASMVSRGLR
jgi:restriction system protein